MTNNKQKVQTQQRNRKENISVPPNHHVFHNVY